MNLEKNDKDENEKQYNNCICKKCNKQFHFENDTTYWNDSGLGYSTKITECPNCGTVNVIKYIEDKGLYVNTDPRYYEYN